MRFLHFNKDSPGPWEEEKENRKLSKKQNKRIKRNDYLSPQPGTFIRYGEGWVEVPEMVNHGPRHLQELNTVSVNDAIQLVKDMVSGLVPVHVARTDFEEYKSVEMRAEEWMAGKGMPNTQSEEVVLKCMEDEAFMRGMADGEMIDVKRRQIERRYL